MVTSRAERDFCNHEDHSNFAQERMRGQLWVGESRVASGCVLILSLDLVILAPTYSSVYFVEIHVLGIPVSMLSVFLIHFPLFFLKLFSPISLH